jgi:hypothetical protein
VKFVCPQISCCQIKGNVESNVENVSALVHTVENVSILAHNVENVSVNSVPVSVRNVENALLHSVENVS